jgi:hypothetical protein
MLAKEMTLQATRLLTLMRTLPLTQLAWRFASPTNAGEWRIEFRGL